MKFLFKISINNVFLTRTYCGITILYTKIRFISLFCLKFCYIFKIKLHMSWAFTNLQFWLIWISFRLGTGINVMSIKLRCQRGRDFLFALSRIIFINIHKWGTKCMTIWGSLIDWYNVKWIHYQMQNDMIYNSNKEDSRCSYLLSRNNILSLLS